MGRQRVASAATIRVGISLGRLVIVFISSQNFRGGSRTIFHTCEESLRPSPSRKPAMARRMPQASEQRESPGYSFKFQKKSCDSCGSEFDIRRACALRRAVPKRAGVIAYGEKNCLWGPLSAPLFAQESIHVTAHSLFGKRRALACFFEHEPLGRARLRAYEQ